MKKILLFTLVSSSLLFSLEMKLPEDVIICPAVYDPVCGFKIEDGKAIYKTYGNECNLKAAEAVKVDELFCKDIEKVLH